MYLAYPISLTHNCQEEPERNAEATAGRVAHTNQGGLLSFQVSMFAFRNNIEVVTKAHSFQRQSIG